jgi:hypothetical protein
MLEGRRFSLHERCTPRVPTSLSALTVQTPYDTPSIPANKMAVFAFQFDGRVHQPPAVKVRVQQVGVFAQRTCWRPHFLRIGISSTTALCEGVASELWIPVDRRVLTIAQLKSQLGYCQARWQVSICGSRTLPATCSVNVCHFPCIGYTRSSLQSPSVCRFSTLSKLF